MDVTRVLGLVRPFFEQRGEPFAVVGGLALLAYGAPRATFDVDLLAPRRVRDDLVAFLEARHFATLGVQAGFSNHQHPEPALGRLDVIYVSGTTAEAVFAGCAARTIAPGVDRQVALKLIAEWGPLVDAAVRRRPIFRGAPFTLPGHQEDPRP